MVVLSLFAPQFLEEEIHRKAVALKAGSGLLLFIGTWILTVLRVIQTKLCCCSVFMKKCRFQQ
jgi:uncharacterized membrane protein (DUF485 family)